MAVDRTVKGLVRSKLTYLEVSTVIDDQIEMYRLETVYMLRECLQPDKDDAYIEVEDNYSFMQNAFISDIVGYLMLLKKTIDSATAGPGEASNDVYLKRVKAGSTEAEYEAFKAGQGGSSLSLETSALLGFLKDMILTKANLLGCSMTWLLPDPDVEPNWPMFQVGSGCGCSSPVSGTWVNGVFVPWWVGKG